MLQFHLPFPNYFKQRKNHMGILNKSDVATYYAIGCTTGGALGSAVGFTIHSYFYEDAKYDEAAILGGSIGCISGALIGVTILSFQVISGIDGNTF
jgi:hypothetical protein